MDIESAEPRTVRIGLSPSRAGDFMTCPLLFRFRYIDRLPEPPSPAAARGTLVHAVLERLFDAPAQERTLDTARSMIPGQWDELRAQEPELEAMFEDETAFNQWLDSSVPLLEKYFELEDPAWLEPQARELRVDHLLESGLGLGGIIDRVDVAPDGAVRVVDYKTGRSPSERYEDRALFQMKFYALVWWRTKGVIPALLQLLYLGDGTVLRYEPVEADLVSTERKIQAIWDAIAQSIRNRQFLPRKSGLCSWCAHRDVCPEFGGVVPPLPQIQLVEATTP